ncbi:MAG: hypothetical protein ACPHLK_08260 [Gammaproteobacteria bacterium]|jgi:hypothetical protein
MKEAFLMGILAMSANADDQDINIQQLITPISVTSGGEQIIYHKTDYVYAITAQDTKADVEPHITRYITQ